MSCKTVQLWYYKSHHLEKSKQVLTRRENLKMLFCLLLLLCSILHTKQHGRYVISPPPHSWISLLQNDGATIKSLYVEGWLSNTKGQTYNNITTRKLWLFVVILLYFKPQHISGSKQNIHAYWFAGLWLIIFQNENDNALYCGGFGVEHQHNGGRCGICGHPWDASPRC